MSLFSFLRAVLLVLLPLALIVGLGKAMIRFVRRHPVAAPHILNHAQKPLNRRLHGYDADDVAAHWAPLSEPRLRQERTLLRLDLVYPLFYGGILMLALLQAWEWLGRPFVVHWLAVPVALTVLADWMENGVQLLQLRRWMRADEPGVKDLSPFLIRLASLATCTKIWLLFGLLSLLIVLAVWTGFTPTAGPPQSAHL